MAYDLNFYAESRQHAVAYLATQSLAPEIEAMLTAAIVNVDHGGPLHVKASGAFPETPSTVVVSAGMFEVSPVNFVDVAPAVIPDETPHPGWRAWLEGVRHPERAKEAEAARVKAESAAPASVQWDAEDQRRRAQALERAALIRAEAQREPEVLNP